METKTSAPIRFRSRSQTWNSGDAICRAIASRCVTAPDRRSISTIARWSSGSKLSSMNLEPASFCISDPLVRNTQRLDDVPIRLRIEPLNPECLSHNAPSVPPLEMNHQLHRVGDIRADRLVGQLDARLQNATCESRKGLGGGIGVNRRQSPRVTRI